MDAMLRFTSRNAELENELAELGYEIIVPTRRGKPIPPESFQLSLARLESPDEFDDCLRETSAALRQIHNVLARYESMTCDAEVDFGINAEEIDGFMMRFTLDPELLKLLSDVGLDLTMSVYGCSGGDSDD